MEKITNVGGRLHNPVVGGALTGANEIKDDTKGKMQNVINQETDAELVRLDGAKQEKLTFDQMPTEGSTNPVTSGGVYAADVALQQAIEAILLLIPSAASALNQLADKSFVNSSISTATATFRGTYNLVTDLGLTVSATHQQIATALASVVSTADNNDYCFVQIPVSDQSTDIRVTERYKFDGTSWEYEYDLNNSGFTAAQWSAINSGITSVLVGKLGGLPTAQELAMMFAGKQNTLTFDSTPVAGSDNPVKSSGLYNAFAAINALIPSGADANNKLVAESRLVAYVTTLINALDAIFDVTSADGHVTLRMTQADGLITSVQILTSDIASASALTTLAGRVSTAESDIDALQDAYAALTQSDVVIVNGTLPSSGQLQNVIYRQPDQDHTPPQFYSDYMWNGTTWVLMATYMNAIDPRPKKGSQNLVTSGGVFDNMGALDVSELNATENPHTLAIYADLSAALAAIPSDYQKGGMSIKFVQSSDNKYVQYRLMSDSFNTTPSNWQGVDDEPTAGSDNLVNSGGVSAAIGEMLIFDGIVSYNAETWEQDRCFYNQDININADALLYYKNENSVAATCRVTYSDDSTRDIGLGANYETVGSLAKDNMTIKHIFCYFGASARPDSNIKIEILQNVGKDLYELNKNFNILKDNGYKYKGIADSVNYSPSTPKGKEFYISLCPGTYSNFSNLVVPSYNIGLLKYDGSAWSVDLLNLSPMVNQGVLTLFNGNVSRSGSSDWNKDRLLYHLWSSWGKTIKFKIDNETNVALSYRLTYTDGTTSSSGINPNTKELNFDSDKEINEVFFYFGSNTNPEGNVKIVAYTNNFYYIEKISEYIDKIYSDSINVNVASGGSVNLKIEHSFQKDKEYYIQIDGSISSHFLLRGYINNVVTELGNVYCGCSYKIIPSKDFDSIGIAKNSVSETGSVAIKLLSAFEWESIQDDNALKIASVGLANRKSTFVSGSNVVAEVVGDFKAGEYYEINLQGSSGSNTFLIYLFSLTNTELYKSTNSYNINRTYIFKCPVNAEKLSLIRNNVNTDVSISIKVRLASVARETKTMPNTIGIPISAHQGNTFGGETIGSPKAWLAASRLGYKWLECDIQFTSDNIPVFLHDKPININGDYVVSKADGTPIDKDDNITVSSLTYQQLKDTYCWADGGEILSLTEGFGFISMLGMNCLLEFKAYADNDVKQEYLRKACLLFGIDRIIYVAFVTEYNIVFPTLINLGIYKRGILGTTSSNQDDIEASFEYAAQIGGALVSTIDNDIDSTFIQSMMEKYGVQYYGNKWADSNSDHQVSVIWSNDIAPVKDSYANNTIVLSNTDVDYDTFTSVGAVTVTSVSNVNLSMIAESGVEIKLSSASQSHKGNVNVAYVKASGTYSVFVKGSGHVTEISVRY